MAGEPRLKHAGFLPFLDFWLKTKARDASAWWTTMSKGVVGLILPTLSQGSSELDGAALGSLGSRAVSRY